MEEMLLEPGSCQERFFYRDRSLAGNTGRTGAFWNTCQRKSCRCKAGTARGCGVLTNSQRGQRWQHWAIWTGLLRSDVLRYGDLYPGDVIGSGTVGTGCSWNWMLLLKLNDPSLRTMAATRRHSGNGNGRSGANSTQYHRRRRRSFSLLAQKKI